MRVRFLSFVALLALVPACSASNGPTGPSDPPPPNVVNYTAIGASDAIGFGSSAFCVPFVECLDGKGYVQVLTRRLTQDGKTVTLLNLGLPGGVLGPEIQNIGNQLGRGILTNFLENQAPFVATDATLVTVFAGGNDINTVGAALDAGYGGADPLGYVIARANTFAADLRTLMDTIKSRAPAARVVVLNLPNMAGLPYAAGYTLTEKKALQEISIRFSAKVNELVNRGAIVVDVMCDSRFYQKNAYSSDGFHPNDTGYANMADAAYGPATTGTGAPPLSSCSQMKLF